MGRASQRAQAERRMAAITPEMLLEMETSMPCGHGAPIGSIEFRNFLTGKVTRWTVLRGTRTNNYALRAPSGKSTGAHGAAWIMDKLRPIFRRQ